MLTEFAKVRTDALGLDVARREGQHTLYILDEPTVGFHTAEILSEFLAERGVTSD